jgi:hypothetical protein
VAFNITKPKLICGGDMTAKVDPSSGNITEYHTAVKIAFGIEH